MLKKSSNKWSAAGVVFMALLAVVFLSGIATADINDQVAQLDIDTATLDDVIDIFGEPIAYIWGNQTYTRDNLPNVYIARYPNDFDVVMKNGYISELRFRSADYLFQGQIHVGSSLDDVLDVVGQPTETVVGQPCEFQDGVLYKDINGTVGYCYYKRSDQNVRFFFRDYNVSALYVMRSTNIPSPPPPVSSVEPFDDIRSMDMSNLDLSGRNGLIETLSFNQETVWPEPAKMPGDWAPDELMTAAMNPGLGVRQLHQRGITGAGVNVAIIDQPMYPDHPEYDGKIAAYYDTGCGGHESSMHGPAVASLLVGENCGTAPGARIYYAAAPSWLRDAAYYADGLDWIIAQNEAMPVSEKIRVVSVSAAPSGPGSPFEVNNHMWDEACSRAEAAGILVLDCTSHRGLISSCWYDLDDPENVAKCTPGFPGYPPSSNPERINVPSSCRTTAQHYDYHGRDSYIYWGRGGLSWSIPYCAGVLAMGWQINPDLWGDQMVDLLFETAYVNPAGVRIINPSAFIDLLETEDLTIRVSDEDFFFSVVSDGPTPEPQILSICNGGPGTLNWVIDEDCDWLEVYPNSGSSTGLADIDDVTLSITMPSLPGLYDCQLTISDPCAVNNPQTVSVVLYVADANFGTIQDAIDSAENGDTVIVPIGFYMGEGNRDLDFKGKAITLSSIDPENPDVVASTVINCQGTEHEPHRGFNFHTIEDANSILEGFTITGGYGSVGGAIRCKNSSPMIVNCVFADNSASLAGGGIHNEDNSNPILINCIFRNNSSDWVAGALRNHTSSPVLMNCLFTGNSASIAGGAIQNENNNSNPILINCTFTGNTASGWAAGIVNHRSVPVISNCIFWGNSAGGSTDESAQIHGGSPVINYSCVQGWTGDLGGVGNIGDDPRFVDAGIGDYRLCEASSCIDAGDPNYVAEPNETDIDGNPRVSNGIIDMGAYEFQVLTPFEMLLGLSEYIDELGLHEGIANSLESKLENALQKLADDNDKNDVAAINSLRAFINVVEALSGKKIFQEDADILIAAAQEIIDILSSE